MQDHINKYTIYRNDDKTYTVNMLDLNNQVISFEVNNMTTLKELNRIGSSQIPEDQKEIMRQRKIINKLQLANEEITDERDSLKKDHATATKNFERTKEQLTQAKNLTAQQLESINTLTDEVEEQQQSKQEMLEELVTLADKLYGEGTETPLPDIDHLMPEDTMTEEEKEEK